MEKAYKFRIYPNREQEQQIQRIFGCVRYVFNHFLAARMAAYEADKATLGYNACCIALTTLKQELEWLREADATALQSALRNLDDAYQNFFRRVKKGEKPGFPRFKSKKNRHRSYETKNNKGTITALERHIKLPKLGLVRAAISRQVEGRILNATVSQTPSGKYFVSVCCTEVDIPKLERTGKTVGLDVGIHNLATDSEGNYYQNQRYFHQSEKQLAKAQRRLSRKPIGSNNREKARVKVALIHEKIANQRHDFLHKLSTRLIREYDFISTESLDIAKMVQTDYLAKMIYDASWGEFGRQLQYKCDWYGKQFVKVDKDFPSSNICSNCGSVLEQRLKLNKRRWKCPVCGEVHDRDTNAAKNILHEGLRLLA